MAPPAKKVKLGDASVPDEQFFGSPIDMISGPSKDTTTRSVIVIKDDGVTPFFPSSSFEPEQSAKASVSGLR